MQLVGWVERKRNPSAAAGGRVPDTTGFEGMTDREKKLLIALVKMVDQYLSSYEDQVDSRSMSAGEHAIEALANFGLMEVVNTRFGRWTEAGKKFVTEIQSGPGHHQTSTPASELGRNPAVILRTKSE